MFDEPFAHGRSLVHAVDPRFRLVAAFVCAVCLAVVRTPEAAWFGFGMAALLLALSRPPMRPVLRRLAVVNVFIAFLWLTVPLTSGGDVIAAWGPLEVSRAGVLLTLLVTIKSNAIVMTFLALVATMDSPTIGYALERLRFPSKLVFLFLFTYRYLHVIADEWHKLHGAARLRGSENNDGFCVRDGKIGTITNHCGGILGGITNGMPLRFRAAVKPTPSIYRPQQSVNLETMEETTLQIQGRHDPCIVPRAVPVMEAAAAIAIYDALLGYQKERM